MSLPRTVFPSHTPIQDPFSGCPSWAKSGKVSATAAKAIDHLVILLGFTMLYIVVINAAGVKGLLARSLTATI
jgi:hypothetical protein